MKHTLGIFFALRITSLVRTPDFVLRANVFVHDEYLGESGE